MIKSKNRQPLPLLLLGVGLHLVSATATRAENIPTCSTNNSRVLEFRPPRELPSQTPTPPPPTPQVTNRTNKNKRTYRVEVRGDSALILAQVRRIEPQAFVRSGEGKIQAGLFQEKKNARKLVEELEAYGLQARVVRVKPKA